MRIVFDAMGGDHAPSAVVEGCRAAAHEWPDTEVVLLGREEVVRPRIAATDPPNLLFQHVSEWIEAEEEPTKAVRRKKDSSIVVGCRMVREGKADAFISAGNTGALMVAGTLVTGRLPGIDRPALAPIFPTVSGRGTLVLDVGANPDARAEHLAQYGLMGSIYAQQVLGFENPRVGLLNIGSESGKGSERVREAYKMLEQMPLNFVGNVEARDVLSDACDVLVCDGFSGNVLLKNTEGVAMTIFDRLKKEFTRSFIHKLAAAVLAPGLRRFVAELDYTEHGGAPLLGLNGPIIKAHGSSDQKAIKNAIRQARLFIEQGVLKSIQQALHTREG